MSRAAPSKGVSLRQAVQALERLAPPELAEDWDNVGLLLAPTRAQPIRRMLLTIDLTPAVADEAIRRGAQLVVAYHPPIFKPLTSIRADDPLSAKILKLAEARIAIYSPHTALDQAEGGVNDWLLDGIRLQDGATIAAIDDGIGRRLTFNRPIAPATLISRLKKLLGLSQLRVALASKRKIKSIALCAGAGHDAMASAEVDAYLTGEMKHHDILAANARGISVFLSEHTHTERGYLPILKKRLREECGAAVAIDIAKHDRDPISWM